MFRAGVSMFARAVGGSCALLAGVAVCVMATSAAQASTAQAATLAGVQLTSGKPVKAVISRPSQKITYTFAATAQHHVTFQVTNFNFSDGSSPGSFSLNFYEPGSTSSYASWDFGDDGYYDFTPPLTGTWKVKLVPDGASVGSTTLTFANDVATQPLASGSPVTTTIKFEGQHAGYAFAGTAGKHVTFQVTKFNFSDGSSPGSFSLNFYKPGSTSPYASWDFGDDGSYDFTPPLSGTWTVQLVPDGASVGSTVLTFANDVATQALASGSPVTTTIKFEGQHAGYAFAGTAGKHVTFQVTNFNFSDGSSPGSFSLNFYKPGSTSPYTSWDFGDDGYYDFTPPLTGTWKVKLVPDGASVGSTVLTFANDVATQPLASGSPVTTTIKFEGQHAGYSFTSTAGARRTFTVKQFNFTDGSSPGSFSLNFYKPGSTSPYTSWDFGDNGSYHFSTPLSGTWTVQLVPDGASVGSMTLTMT